MKRNQTKPKRASKRNDRGAALLEFGMVMLVFFMFVFGVMDFGRALYNYHFVSHAAREATRYAIVRGSTSTDPVTANEISAYVKNITPLGINPQDITVSTSWTPNDAPGSSVRVEVSDSFRPMMPFFTKYHMQFSDASQMVISQ